MSLWRRLMGPAALAAVAGAVFLLPPSWGSEGDVGDLIILSTTSVGGEIAPCG
jgi:hypothetical protein